MSSSIYNSLKKTNQYELSISSLVAIGATSLILNFPIAGTILLCSSLPSLMLGLYTRKELNKKENMNLNLLSYGIQGVIHKKAFHQWLVNYVENSSSLTERKYKILLMEIYFKHTDLNRHELILNYTPTYRYLNKVCQELMDKKETNINLMNIIKEHKDLDYILLLNEDLPHPEKIAIGKEVLKEYNEVGLLGKSFNNWCNEALPFLMVMQDYQLNKKDIFYIKKLCEKEKLTQSDILINFEYDKKYYQNIDKIIESNCSTEQINALSLFFNKLHLDSKDEQITSKKIVNYLEKKKNYQQLNEILEVKQEISRKKL